MQKKSKSLIYNTKKIFIQQPCYIKRMNDTTENQGALVHIKCIVKSNVVKKDTDNTQNLIAHIIYYIFSKL